MFFLLIKKLIINMLKSQTKWRTASSASTFTTHSEVLLTCKILAFSSKQPRCHRSTDPTVALFHIYNLRRCDYRLA